MMNARRHGVEARPLTRIGQTMKGNAMRRFGVFLASAALGVALVAGGYPYGYGY
jgi:hypothetical protein